jgi:hypothetical protein
VAAVMINKLTDEQIGRFPEFVDKWTRIGLSIDPACRQKAEMAINQVYKYAGIKQPRKIVWCGSPLSQGLTRSLILDKKFVWASVGDSVRASVWASVGDSVWASVGDSVWASVRASVWDSVGDSVWDSVWASVWASVGDSVWASVRASVWASVRASVWASVGASVWASVRASVWDSVGDSVGDSVWASVGDSVWASVRASVWASVRASVWDSVGDSVWDSGYGQHDAGWLGFYDYFKSVLNLKEQTERLQGLAEYSQNAGWFLPHANICWVSERHNVLRRDERGRIHSETGPAIAYPDGWSIYAWHGIRVPESVIEKRNEISVTAILKEQNTEVRRVMRNLYGNERFMQDAGAKEIDAAPSHKARLLTIHLPGDPVEIRMVELTCPSTGNKYMERVPPDVRSAIEALSWRFNVKPAEYKPELET